MVISSRSEGRTLRPAGWSRDRKHGIHQRNDTNEVTSVYDMTRAEDRRDVLVREKI